MQTIWQLTYETIPGNGEQTRTFKSFALVKQEMKKMISRIDILSCTEDIRKGPHTVYRMAMADFLDDYVKRETFLGKKDRLPSDNPYDYEMLKTSPVGDSDGEAVDGIAAEDEVDDDLEDFDIDISKNNLCFDSYYEGRPHLATNMVTMEDEKEIYDFEFYMDRPAAEGKFRELQIRIVPLEYWGTSAYPLLILEALNHSYEHLDQKRLSWHIEAVHNTKIERKAIGRNIALLQDLGYDIRHDGAGYYIHKKASSLSEEEWQLIETSILNNPALDEAKKRQLIGKLSQL